MDFYKPSRSRAMHAFTLIELLVVIGIIALLVGITIPVVHHVRQSGQVANTHALIAAMSNAIQSYHQDHSAYPGLFSNADIISGTKLDGAKNLTMSENLVLSLMGGVARSGGTFAYVPADVGKGAVSLSPYATKRYPKYLDIPDQDLSRVDQQLGSTIPEVLDRMDNPRPILYLRAQVGAEGVIAAGTVNPPFQYNTVQYRDYLLPTDGLQEANVDNTTTFGNSPYRPLPYFRNPALGGTDNSTSTPRQKDAYILISAGPDGIYGTDDDITNFGAVRP